MPQKNCSFLETQRGHFQSGDLVKILKTAIHWLLATAEHQESLALWGDYRANSTAYTDILAFIGGFKVFRHPRARPMPIVRVDFGKGRRKRCVT
jgi:hypothetical protein